MVSGRDKDATNEGLYLDPATKAAFENVAAAVAKQLENLTPAKAALEKAAAAVAAALPAVPAVPPLVLPDPILPALPEIDDFPITELPTPGRPKGPPPVTTYLVAALKRRLDAAGKDAEWTPIAVDIYKALGFRGEKTLKNKADHLVRAAKKILGPQRFK